MPISIQSSNAHEGPHEAEQAALGLGRKLRFLARALFMLDENGEDVAVFRSLID